MTEQDIQYALGQHLFLKNVCIPNVLMSGVKKAPYEADFIYFNLNKLHLTEVEIKTDINDFRNDFKKACYHDNHNVMYLYYAVPRSLYDDHWDVIDEMLGNAGLILLMNIVELTLISQYIKLAVLLKEQNEEKVLLS